MQYVFQLNKHGLPYPESMLGTPYAPLHALPYFRPELYSQPQVFYPSQPAVPDWSQVIADPNVVMKLLLHR